MSKELRSVSKTESETLKFTNCYMHGLILCKRHISHSFIQGGVAL